MNQRGSQKELLVQMHLTSRDHLRGKVSSHDFPISAAHQISRGALKNPDAQTVPQTKEGRTWVLMSGRSLGDIKVENHWSKQLLSDIFKCLHVERDPHLNYYNSARIHLPALHMVNHPACHFPT